MLGPDGVLEPWTIRARKASWRCGPGWPSMFRGYLGEEERYRKCFVGGWYLTGDLVRRDARRLLLVRRPGRRRHQVGRASDRAVRGGERAARAPRGGGGRRDRQARSGRRRGGEGIRGARPRATSRARSCGSSCSAFGRRRLGAAVAPKRDRVRRLGFRTPAAARSCGGCSRPASSGCPRATPRRWSRRREHGSREADSRRSTASMGSSCCGRCCASAASRSDASSCTARTKIRGFLHLYIGEEAVAVGVMQALGPEDAIVATYREHGHALVRGVSAGSIMAEMYGKVEGCAAAAAGRCTSSTPPLASTAATRSSAVGSRSPSVWRSPTSCKAAGG